MKYTHKDMFDEVLQSGKYTSRIAAIKALAQLIYSNDRAQSKTDCAWEALEKYESMTGYYFDPTHDQLDEIANSVI